MIVSDNGTEPTSLAILTWQEERGVEWHYIDDADGQGRPSSRTIWPFAVAYYVEATLIGAWCELRDDFRHFRADRVQALTVLDEGFPVPGRRLAADWLERFSRDVTADGALTSR